MNNSTNNTDRIPELRTFLFSRMLAFSTMNDIQIHSNWRIECAMLKKNSTALIKCVSLQKTNSEHWKLVSLTFELRNLAHPDRYDNIVICANNSATTYQTLCHAVTDYVFNNSGKVPAIEITNLSDCQTMDSEDDEQDKICMDSDEFRKWGKEMVDFVADYWKNMRDLKPTSDVQPGFMKELIPDEAPQDPEPWENIFGDLNKVVVQGNTHWHHPHFFAYFPTANSYPAIIGDILSAGLASIGFTWNSSPSCTELEVVVMDWLAKMLKLPKEFFNSDPGPGVGMIQCTASDCTLVALLAARNRLIRNEFTGEFDSNKISKLVAYSSEEAHSSVERAGLLSAINIRKITTDKEYAMRGSDLEIAIKEDLNKGLIPFFVCATLGTTPSCAFDKLEEIGPICRQYNLFLHVDAAYAGSAFICPEYRHLLNGIELADSFNFNAHKFMLVNFDCAPMWFKDAKEVERAFLVDPTYLKHDHQGGKVPDFRHLQIPLGRRFRSLKLWFVLRSFGIKGIQEYIRKQCALAKIFSDLVTKDERFELAAPLNLGLVCFRLKNNNEKTEQLYKLLNEDRRIHLVPSHLKEKYILRFCISSSLTNDEDIKFAWNVITELTSKLT